MYGKRYIGVMTAGRRRPATFLTYKDQNSFLIKMIFLNTNSNIRKNRDGGVVMKEKVIKEPRIEVIWHFSNGSKTLQSALEEMALKVIRGK